MRSFVVCSHWANLPAPGLRCPTARAVQCEQKLHAWQMCGQWLTMGLHWSFRGSGRVTPVGPCVIPAGKPLAHEVVHGPEHPRSLSKTGTWARLRHPPGCWRPTRASATSCACEDPSLYPRIWAPRSPRAGSRHYRMHSGFSHGAQMRSPTSGNL